jgi:hypothetical protein
MPVTISGRWLETIHADRYRRVGKEKVDMKVSSTARAVLIGLALVALLGAACGSDDGNSNAGSGQASSQESQQEGDATETTETPTIVASEFKYDAPDVLPAGKSTIKFKNAGKQPHIAVFVELLQGKTIDDVNALIEKNPNTKPPSWVREVDVEAAAKPGETTQFTGNFTPGTYAMLCFVPDQETKKSHAQLGMTTEIVFE